MPRKKAAAEDTAVLEEKVPAAEKPVKKTTVRKSAAKKAEEQDAAAEKPAKKATGRKAAAKKAEEQGAAGEKPVKKTAIRKKSVKEPDITVEIYEEPMAKKKVAFIGSECYPFVKTGGLGDVMYALPKALVKQGVEVRVMLPKYYCIPQQWKDKMVYRGSFMMDLCEDGREYYVGIMEYIADGVTYDFIDNEEFFTAGNPYINLIDDIPRYCYFSKATLAVLNYLEWVPDVIHCHDWQASLVPVYLRTLFSCTPVAQAKSMLTIHNLRFQGIYNIPTIKYWTGLPGFVFNIDALKTGYDDANMLKGGLAYADMITTVSETYAKEIQTGFYGENLDAHMRYHAGKLRGIVNGIDVEQWDSATDPKLAVNYNAETAIAGKKADKKALQAALGLEQDEGKFVVGLVSRLTDQKGLDLVNAILPELMDGKTQIVVLGTGDKVYEDAFRALQEEFQDSVSAKLLYDEGLAHSIYAGCDAFLVPSLFEPCGLTQLIAMRYGTVPIVRETGGLKDTVAPYNALDNSGNGFTFVEYESAKLLDAINSAKALYFDGRDRWDEMVRRDMRKDVSWNASADQYLALYDELK